MPKGNVVGEVNGGWRLITNQLNHERVGLAALAGQTFRLYDDMRRVVPHDAVGPTAGVMLDVPWVQADLARGHAKLEAMKLLNWRMAAAVADGTLGPADSSAVKVFGIETHDRGVPAACSGSSARPATCPRARPVRCSGATSSGRRGPRRSTPSAAE